MTPELSMATLAEGVATCTNNQMRPAERPLLLGMERHTAATDLLAIAACSSRLLGFLPVAASCPATAAASAPSPSSLACSSALRFLAILAKRAREVICLCGKIRLVCGPAGCKQRET